MNRHHLNRAVVAALLALLLIGSGAHSARAHRGDQSYLYLQITDVVQVEVHLPFTDLNRHLGLDLQTDDPDLDGAIGAARERLDEFARAHVAIEGAGEQWRIGASDVSRLLETDYVLVRFEVDLEPDDVPDVLDVTFDPFFDEDATRDALFLIFNDWERGYVNNEADPLSRFTPDDRTKTIDIGNRSWTKNMTSSISLGVDHIKTGPDHILFVAVLLLPSVLVFARGGWVPTERFGASLWRVLKIVSMFTVAHSVTFTLAGLSIIPLPSSKLVETIIAVSIAAAALHNLRPIAPEREWLIAFAFGLFHGLGFASLVDDLQVSRSTRLVSLLGRNIGIELGQAFVVVIVFPALFLLRRTRFYMPVFTAGSWVLVLISLGWVTERLFDAPAVTTTLVDRVIAWPRALLLVGAVTLASAALLLYERNRGRLLAVES